MATLQVKARVKSALESAQGHTVATEDLLAAGWGEVESKTGKEPLTLRVIICMLRKEYKAEHLELTTVRGVGYQLQPAVAG
jgi:DNA-binding response OmpR family regulator